MKNLLPLLIIASIFGSCDIIEEPFKEDSLIPNDTTNPTAFVKKILMEDYSGHTCSNCPNAARELEALIDIYGQKIVPITIHVGKTYARPYHISQAPKYQYDFRTETGESWNNFFQITNLGLPKGMINRLGHQNSTHGIEVANWNTIIQTTLDEEPDFGITISPNINSNSGNIDVNIKALNDIQGDFNLVVCLTEDNIINWQKDVEASPNVDVEFYVHRHVFRTSINSAWGEALQTTSSVYNANEEITKSYNINLEELEEYNTDYSLNTLELGNGNAGGWNKNNMYVVAFIYDNTNFEIEQVQEAHLITH